MNPNMALVIAEGQDAQSKTMITVQMVDLVTGKIFFSANHKKVTKALCICTDHKPGFVVGDRALPWGAQ